MASSKSETETVIVGAVLVFCVLVAVFLGILSCANESERRRKNDLESKKTDKKAEAEGRQREKREGELEKRRLQIRQEWQKQSDEESRKWRESIQNYGRR